MLKKIGIAVLLAVVVLLAAIATRPASFKVERSATIAAPADVVYANVVDFKKWEAWSPWAKLDPASKSTFEGTDGAVGSSMAWSGNDKVGKGKMTITKAEPAKQVEIKLEFQEPFKATNTTVFALAPDGAGTKVTWTMSGENDFMGKAMSMFMNMDEMVGKDFDKGLAQMRTADEEEAKKVAEAKKKAEEEAAAAAAAAAANPDAAVAADSK
jgi:hypothetical protein